MTAESFISIRELSEKIGLSRQHIYRLCEAGKITSYKPFGRKLFFDWKEVENIIKGSVQPTDTINKTKTQ